MRAKVEIRPMMFIVFNPVAGNANPVLLQKQVGELSAELYTTLNANDDVFKVVRNAIDNGYTKIVAAGGDGLVNDVAMGVYQTSATLGIIPMGTGNVVARELGIPLDPEDAIQLLVSGGQIRPIDVMLINDRVYLSHVGCGIYTESIENTSPTDKQRFGRVAYIVKGVQQIGQAESFTFDLKIDGKEHAVVGSQLMVTNMAESGIETVSWGPTIAPDDGVLDVLVLTAETATEFIRLVGDVLRERHEDSAEIQHLHARETVEFANHDQLMLFGGGREISDGAVNITLKRLALPILVPL